MRDTVIVFARAPRLGTVNRRLAREIGDRAALRFHIGTLMALLRELIAAFPVYRTYVRAGHPVTAADRAHVAAAVTAARRRLPDLDAELTGFIGELLTGGYPGAAEAGFFPGVIFYITLWFPSVYRARIVSLFMLAIPFSSIVGAPLSGALLGISGAGLDGWQWLFLLEGVPACIVAFVVLFYLPDRPHDARWRWRRRWSSSSARSRTHAKAARRRRRSATA